MERKRLARDLTVFVLFVFLLNIAVAESDSLGMGDYVEVMVIRGNTTNITAPINQTVITIYSVNIAERLVTKEESSFLREEKNVTVQETNQENVGEVVRSDILNNEANNTAGTSDIGQKKSYIWVWWIIGLFLIFILIIGVAKIYDNWRGYIDERRMIEADEREWNNSN